MGGLTTSLSHVPSPSPSPHAYPYPTLTSGQEPEVGKEIYYIGCIDILCEYGLKKQLEHHYKVG